MTKGSDVRPTRRMMAGFRGDHYAVELRSKVVIIRPKGARRGGPAEVTVTPGAMYVRAMMAQAEARKAMKRRGRRGAR
jgi:hypothetical protein